MGVTTANQRVISIPLILVNPDLFVSGEQGVWKDLLYNKADHSLKGTKKYRHDAPRGKSLGHVKTI